MVLLLRQLAATSKRRSNASERKVTGQYSGGTVEPESEDARKDGPH
jgi:hypothetical protein